MIQNGKPPQNPTTGQQAVYPFRLVTFKIVALPQAAGVRRQGIAHCLAVRNNQQLRHNREAVACYIRQNCVDVIRLTIMQCMTGLVAIGTMVSGAGGR